MSDEDFRRSFVVSSAHDPAALAALARFYETRGISLHGSYSTLVATAFEETLSAHRIRPWGVTQDQAIAALREMGFSIKQLESDRGRKRAARRARVEELAASREATPAALVPPHLRAKLDGEDTSPWTDEELFELVQLGLVTPEQAAEYKTQSK